MEVGDKVGGEVGDFVGFSVGKLLTQNKSYGQEIITHTLMGKRLVQDWEE